MYDLAIIGAGPAGYSAAFEAIKNNFSVILFERDLVGGTCLNRGCVPTKFLLHVARKYYEAKNSDDGINCNTIDIDFSKTKEKMKRIINTLRIGLISELEKSGVTIIKGNALIEKNDTIISNNIEYKVKNIIIATGSVPNEPIAVCGKTSDEILELDYIPQNIKIIGGGSIAVEFAEIFKMLGSNVEILIRGDRILRKWDKEIAISLTQSLKKNGVILQKECAFDSLQYSANETVLSANGRKASIPDVASTLFDIGKNGGIIVDKNFQTKTKGIFAAGDVIENSSQLAHVAMEQGRQIVQYIVNSQEASEKSIINCIYTNPEIATVGITEKESKELNLNIITAKITMYSNARTLISTNERGFIKVIASKDTRKILGAQLMCEHAGELVSEFAMAIDNKMTIENMLLSIRPHPSYCESIQDVLLLLQEKANAV